MKTFKIFSLLLVAAVGFASCDDDDDDVSQTTIQKLQNRWAVDSVSLKYVSGSDDSTVAYTGTAGDYYDFRADNNLYYQLGPTMDTVPYTLINDQLINVDGDTAQIEVLNSNRLQAFWRSSTDSADYIETRAYLRR